MEDIMLAYSLRQCILSLFGLLLGIVDCIISLQLLELRVPAHVPLGARVALSCRWQLGPADVLYSVKWYKDGKEFFRHVPRDFEPSRKYPLPGVDVEDSDASGSSLTLSPVVTQTGGRYRCEVSGERPLFPTVSEHADMAVLVPPDQGPFLSGFRPRYGTGDRVQVNCTSGRSLPPTELSWYINEEPAPSNAVLPPTYKRIEDLETTSSKLDFVVTEQHFRNSGIKIKCLATLSPIYWRSSEESAQKKRSHDRLAVRSSEKPNTRADLVRSSVKSVDRSVANIVGALLCVVMFY